MGISREDLPNQKGDIGTFNLTLYNDVIVSELTNKRIRFYIDGELHWSKKRDFWGFWNDSYESVPIYKSMGRGKSPKRTGQLTLDGDYIVVNGRRKIESGLFYAFVSPYTDFKNDKLYINEPATETD